MNYEEMPIISEGTLNEEAVIILQQKLKIVGFYPNSITGSFGNVTKQAVDRFQTANNLVGNGIVDGETWQVLFEQTKAAFPTPRLNRPLLELGSTGDLVGDLQRQLTTLLYYNGPINGNFDQATRNAVKEFQLINKITASGRVDTDTWSALTYLYSPLAICGNVETGDTYTVQPGDTLWNIANKFNTNVDELRRINNLTSDILQVGQVLKIRQAPTEVTDTYIVQRGDTLWNIASRFNTSVAILRTLNNLSTDVLQIGQVLNIPNNNSTPNPPTPTYNTYTVSRGDSLWSIANRYQITVDELKRINQLTSNILSIGQVLNVPNSTTTPTPEYINYTVVRGDTLFNIATRYNTTVQAIRQLNNLTTDTLSIGQPLRIPR